MRVLNLLLEAERKRDLSIHDVLYFDIVFSLSDNSKLIIVYVVRYLADIFAFDVEYL